jgi:hypothetical protein
MSQQTNELRIVLQQIGIMQAMFREAIARFERLAAEAGYLVTLVPTDDFVRFENGASRQDLECILNNYEGSDAGDHSHRSG